jgi:hypothetical protein
MARIVSTEYKRAAFAAQTDEVALTLLELTHPDLTAPVYIVNNDEEIVSNGKTYLPFPFQPTWPTDKGDELPQASLVIDNIDRSIQLALKACRTAPKCKMILVLASQPDTIEASFPLIIKSVKLNQATIQATLTGPLILNEPFPWIKYNPHDYPALFQQK